MTSKMTPMMRQYMDIKRDHQNEILFFRMGDFYEMFFEDAKEASKILDIALTSRQNDVPMCGIPYHACDSYIARLIKAGKRVAICEQLETVPSSGTIVKRDVVRIITPGTVTETNLLPEDSNNYLASVIISEDSVGLAFVDISTGDFYLSTIEKSIELFRGEIAAYRPTEVVFREGAHPDDSIYNEYLSSLGTPLYRINEWLYDGPYMEKIICENFSIGGLKGLGIVKELEIITAGSIIQYLSETQKKSLGHLKYPKTIMPAHRMVLDDATINNLELVYNTRDKSKRRTLFSVLDETRTPMGKRTLERAILQPLTSIEEIEKRLDYVQYLHEYHSLTDTLRDELKNIHDIERLISRFALGRANPRYFVTLKNSIWSSLRVREILMEQEIPCMKKLAGTVPDLGDLASIIDSAVEDEPAISPGEGRVIRRGYREDLDRLQGLKSDAKSWIARYQDEEKERLGISTLKVKYNKILGYYLEVSKRESGEVPPEYFRKQTLVGSERYTTETLQNFETDVLKSADKIVEIEREEIEGLNALVNESARSLQSLAAVIGEIDFYVSLAVVSVEQKFIRPVFNNEKIMHVRGGRHPVVEKYYTKEVFIPNDINLDNDQNIIKIITGPNMSGKSTYIRMTAIIQLMSQIGSFIPAEEGNISPVDRIFTRIGASDNISRGESTFLVEMNETANILNNATDRSLIIMDEIGRGTSTYDGLAIAWGVVEYILGYLRARTLFATHYHELTGLKKEGIQNYNVMVKEHMKGVEFMHKVVPGAADRSYGIHVAKLAGLPIQIIERSQKLLLKFEKRGKTSRPFQEKPGKTVSEETEQLEIFNASNHIVIQALRSIDTDSLTPLEALNELYRLKGLID